MTPDELCAQASQHLGHRPLSRFFSELGVNEDLEEEVAHLLGQA